MKTKFNEDMIEYPLLENKADQEYFEEMNTFNFIERKRFDKLEIEKYYQVYIIERVSTKYWPRILATLIDENKFNAFLLKRFN